MHHNQGKEKAEGYMVMARNIEYEIIEHIATIRSKENGYTVQVNTISWNGADPKVDIRNWDENGRPLKGITLTESEAAMMAEILLDKINY